MNLLQKSSYAFAITALGLSSMMTTQSYAAAATTQQATNNLVKQLSSIQSLTADFEQSTRLTQARNSQQQNKPTPQHLNQNFSGVMKVARPGKFYWETTKPAKQTIVTTGQSVWIYDPDLQQAVKQSLDDQVANTPALLLSGNAQEIMNAYTVGQPDASKTYYSLTPKNKEGAFERLLISFGPNKAPTLMILEDSMGQTTTIKFKNVKLNAQISNSVFNFTPPKGTDIIEQ
ncbi:outer membrane lipoprotein chaperone LolA [Acinetobacter populi]|uniref:Outer-membrane lipoprotein carrier protein n=1 Tax=Acinetobacter populi TaxID=1582270 RepID=A0A1Z9Z1T2_9GAMM|nr:outer membrane lipoprotein chaperone LolA [Acinetobacter populi]OUY08382.1 outer membrane lipoprotein carrier protein LolA [Acinetobacter populi]